MEPGAQQASSFSAKRIPELDGVRGLAIVLVLVLLWHYVQNHLVTSAGSPLGDFKQFLFLWLVLTAIYMRFTMPGLSAYINMFWRADSLMIGALLAWYIRRQSFVAWVEPRRLIVLALLVLFAAGILLANQYGRLKLGGGLTHISLAVFYGLFILYVIINREGLAAQVMRSHVLAWLGSISYGVYLFHANIIKIVHGLIQHDSPQLLTWSDALITILALAITLLLAQLSFSLFEKRIIRIGRKYKYK